MYRPMFERSERHLMIHNLPVYLGQIPAKLVDISESGLACILEQCTNLKFNHQCNEIKIITPQETLSLGSGRLVRWVQQNNGDCLVGFTFELKQTQAIARMQSWLRPYPYVSGELRKKMSSLFAVNDDVVEQSLDKFQNCESSNLTEKCERFKPWIDGMQQKKLYQRLYRVTTVGALDHKVTVFDSVTRRERQMRCFDSNGYLGLHRHPRVIEEVNRVMRLTGYGTPSAQMLCGTNKYLRELEEKLSAFHNREDTIVFPTGFAANTGTISALTRKCDSVICDQYAHASIQEGCRSSAAKVKKRFKNNNIQSLEKILTHTQHTGLLGKLVITDGVFSMHGDVCPLPELLASCRRHKATLMIDDAHGFGVLGRNGRGIEQHFGVEGQVDILMGTLSKAVGCMGGYVTGNKELIDYLRWFAGSALFTTSLPAALCAGMAQALSIIDEEPEHLQKLWSNIHYFSKALCDVGLATTIAVSPITTLFVGPQRLLWTICTELFDAGIKCGGVIYPAVGKNQCILRFALTARHEREDLDYSVDTLAKIFKKHGVHNHSTPTALAV